MKRLALLCLGSLLLSDPADSQIVVKEPLSIRQTYYKIDAMLDTITKVIDGRMEYTTLFTSISFTGVSAFLHLPEMVTIHEFGHAYFMGILVSNEFEESWLDEGVNQIWGNRILDHYYGANSGMLTHQLLKISDKSVSRSSYVYSDSRQVVTNKEYLWNRILLKCFIQKRIT